MNNQIGAMTKKIWVVAIFFSLGAFTGELMAINGHIYLSAILIGLAIFALLVLGKLSPFSGTLIFSVAIYQLQYIFHDQRELFIAAGLILMLLSLLMPGYPVGALRKSS